MAVPCQCGPQKHIIAFEKFFLFWVSMNIQKDWKANLKSAYSFMLKYSEITVCRRTQLNSRAGQFLLFSAVAKSKHSYASISQPFKQWVETFSHFMNLPFQQRPDNSVGNASYVSHASGTSCRQSPVTAIIEGTSIADLRI